MKILVVFYSRTGNTKKVAQEIARNLKANIDEVIDLKNRMGFLNLLISCKDVIFKKLTKIENKKDPFKYSLVIIGAPIWVGTIAPAIRSYFIKNKFKNVAFFCTSGSKRVKKGFKEMERLTKKPVASLMIRKKEIIKKR